MGKPNLLSPRTPERPAAARGTTLSLWDVIQLHCEARLTEWAAEATVKILEARRRVAAATVITQETEADMARVKGSGGAEPSRRVLDREVEVERLLLEAERLRWQRRLLAAGASATFGSETGTGAAAIEWDLDGRRIEGLAVKAVARFSQLPSAEAERAWATWRSELARRFPAYAAAEVERRAGELLDLLHSTLPGEDLR